MVRDVNFYKFLKEAIVNKYRNANALDFRTIEYDPWIYKWARDTFRELKTPEFLNIQNRDVLERLYERLHIDPRLKPLDDPDLALGNKDYQLSESFHQQHEADRLVAQQKVTAAAGPAPGGEGATTPSSSRPPVIHNIPQISPTGISQNLPRRVPVLEEGPATAKARRLDGAKAIQEKGAASPGVRMRPGFGNTLRNFSSRVRTFFQRNAGKYLTKYLTIGRAATGIGAVIGGFAGAGLTGGSSVGVLGGAVGGGILPSWFKSGGGGRFFGNLGNGAINSFSRLSNQISGPRFLTGGASKRIVWVFLGMFLLFAIGASVIGGLVGGGGTPAGESGNVGIGTATPSAGVQPIPVAHPTAPTVDPSGYKQKIIDQFGITMNNFDNDHLKWAWEKFWDVSNTNFPQYIKGVTITKSGDTRKVNCSTLQIDQYPEELFKLTLMHEFGHIIQDCDLGLPRQLAEHQNANAKEGGVTYYANHAVACDSYYNIQEDYAEMIAYYLNPNTNVPTARCTPSGFTNPRIKQKFPLHYNVVRTILGEY